MLSKRTSSRRRSECDINDATFRFAAVLTEGLKAAATNRSMEVKVKGFSWTQKLGLLPSLAILSTICLYFHDSAEALAQTREDRCASGLTVLEQRLLSGGDTLAAEYIRGLFGWQLMQGAAEPDGTKSDIVELWYCDNLRDSLPIFIGRADGDFQTSIGSEFFSCSAFILSHAIMINEKYGRDVEEISFLAGKIIGSYAQLFYGLGILDVNPTSENIKNYFQSLFQFINENNSVELSLKLQQKGQSACKRLSIANDILF